MYCMSVSHQEIRFRTGIFIIHFLNCENGEENFWKVLKRFVFD